MKIKVKHTFGHIFPDGFETAVVSKQSGGWTTVKTRDNREFKYRNSQVTEVPFDTPDHAPDIDSVPKELRHLIPTSTALRIMGELVPKSEYVVTKDVKTKSGRVSVDNNDPTAKQLRGLTLDEVYDIVSDARVIPVRESRDRFKHLNAGMQRMNLGNMLRKATR